MEESLVRALHARRSQIRERWEALLRVERASSALGHPDTLVHLLDPSLDEVLRALSVRRPAGRGAVAPQGKPHSACACGRNPLLHFFNAGEQALLEAVVLAQSDSPKLDPVARDRAVAKLFHTLRSLAHAEVAVFCSLCQYRQEASAHGCALLKA